ncbi:hypothetical protein NK718_00765 [Alsobacter sp. SYSU M60028]|uniref:Cell division protein FtsK n=1 Tax=Alsobacter ponti TaxID=2962936 RepID=A0ABT1L6M0_9HYPH|nr:hypothetical protein [Alsobacter ponti]MCP8937036.1 hypothetical protein [Alsobacter ponti]
MLVYGDAAFTRSTREALAAAAERWRRADAAVAALRHSERVTAFLSVAELAQGIADAAFHRDGQDETDPASDGVLDLLTVLARGLLDSWRGSETADGEGEARRRFASLAALDVPETVSCRKAEGYAFYALYPESYGLAALTSGLRPRTRVIGLRSIGTGLAAMVAAALGARAVTLRPHGDPFRRELAIGPRLSAWLLADVDAAFAVVDEGPGLSGSSFGCVVDWLEAHGVARERIHLFPSHAGPPGPQADPAHRARWETLSRHVVSFEDAVLPRLGSWVGDLTGGPQSPLEDVSGGAWRERAFPSESDWPAANVAQERRKYLLRAGGRAWLLKFAGLGEAGEAAFARARVLGEACFTPPPSGLRNGFLVREWIEGARPVDNEGPLRPRLLARVGEYLGFRALSFPAGPEWGASLAELSVMAERNAGLALGPEAARRLARWRARLPELERAVRRVATDNRMHAHEWLVVGGDAIVKTDAVDHCAAHDLIGCQDIGWDVAGAAVEFKLTERELSGLCERVGGRAGREVSRDLLAFLLPCYAAFQLGAATMAADGLAGSAEEKRLRAEATRYAAVLKRRL